MTAQQGTQQPPQAQAPQAAAAELSAAAGPPAAAGQSPAMEQPPPQGAPLAGVDEAFWRDRRVLVTGHTGFKGAWLCLWLQSLGARVSGFSRGVPSEPSLYGLARVGEGMEESIEGDIRDAAAVQRALERAAPEVVVHMAAQPLVRRSYEQPRETFECNVMGTVNVLEAVRHSETARAVVCVTSDKCYENREWERPYREDDRLGGHDPYSASKGAAEIVVSAYRRSFFSDPGAAVAGDSAEVAGSAAMAGSASANGAPRAASCARVASARAGNVFGGGDWGCDRLIPDVMRCATEREVLRVRNPASTRPWQHVLCPLSGYLLLAQALCEPSSRSAARESGSRSAARYAGAWNFGPPLNDARPVGWIVRRMAELWPGGIEWREDEGPHPHEAGRLQLDSSRAHQLLGWRPPLTLEQGLAATVEWHRALADGRDMREATLAQIGAGRALSHGLQPAL